MTTKIKYGAKELERDIGGLTFGKLLESHRKAEGQSQKDFAKFLGISQSSLCDLEKGRKIPSPSRALSIAKILGVAESVWIELALQDQLREQNIDFKVVIPDEKRKLDLPRKNLGKPQSLRPLVARNDNRLSAKGVRASSSSHRSNKKRK